MWLERQLSARGIRLENWAIWVLWVSVVLLAIWAFNNSAIINALGQMFPAVVSVAGAVAVAILTHLFTQLREQENQQRRALQENYMEVLGEIGKLMRERASSDEFSSVHLKTRVVGSKSVIAASTRLMEAKRDDDSERSMALDNLITAMRTDVGIGQVDIPLPNTLFEPPPPTGRYVPQGARTP